MSTRVAVVGATGRMGTLLCRLIDESADFVLAAQLSSKHPLSTMLDAEIVVDVTVPAVSPAVVDFAVENGLNVLVGTSGWTADRIAAVSATVSAKAEESKQVGVIFVPNFSLGSVLATRFAATAAPFYESIEIVEAHGASKIDSPSGTAIRAAELMSSQRSNAGTGIVAAPHADQRARGQQVAGVPVHSIRLQGVVAQQDVLFGGAGEVLTIRHETLSPSAYERGIMLALRALPSATGVTVGLDEILGLPPLAAPAGGSAGAGGAE